MHGLGEEADDLGTEVATGTVRAHERFHALRLPRRRAIGEFAPFRLREK